MVLDDFWIYIDLIKINSQPNDNHELEYIH